MGDSLKNSFTIIKDNKGFRTSLPVGVSLGGSFNLTKSVSLGILSYSVIEDKRLRQSMTLSANVNLGNAFSTSIAYTAENSRYNNLGAGLAFRLGILQFYLITDKIPVIWNKIQTKKSSIIMPADWNSINLRFGMNITMGNKIKKKNDKPMLPEQN